MSEITYAYAQPSALTATTAGNSLQLAACAEDAPAGGAACFFRGQLRDSWLAARGLSTLAKVVAARFVPPAVQDRLREWSQTAALKKLTGSLLQKAS
ncbi:hypothetical protein A0257_03330 [Hymenobacter psoromatis]|nr:hypothetical protein A0257_03330 [Hymenobacter psoromatis]